MMPKGLITHAWFEIYPETVCIGINLRKSFSLVIEDKDVADSFRVYANLIWQTSKPFKG